MTCLTDLTEKAENLRGIWMSSIEGQCPAVQQFGRWMLIHHGDDELVAWGIRELALKLNKKPMNDDHKVRFVSSVINSKAREGSIEAQP